jgi:putative heme iron utilization protein
LKRRYLARHPEAANYAGFADFKFYAVDAERLHLVAGFGRISWMPATAVLLDAARTGTLAEEEEGILAHMNADHADAVDLYARAAEPDTVSGWRMTGIDPEGADLRRDGRATRLALPDWSRRSARLGWFAYRDLRASSAPETQPCRLLSRSLLRKGD